jgi:dGTPase
MLQEVALPREIIAEVDGLYPGLDDNRRGHETTRRLITRMVEDVIAQTRANLVALSPSCVGDIYAAGRTTAEFSAEMAKWRRN